MLSKTSVFHCLIAAAFCLASPFAVASPELMAALSVMGYGYKVNIKINGADTGVQGGKSESKRLFNKDHAMAAQATPEIRARNFVLVPGKNEIAIEYSKIDPKTQDELEITLEAENYPKPLLRLLNKSKAADKLVVSVDIAEKAPAKFKPVTIENK
jgi:hypothetical protein